MRAKKAILAGDHLQLKPTIISKEAKLLATSQGYFSMFERMHAYFPEQSKMLTVQYRANSLIMEFMNKEIYGGKI